MKNLRNVFLFACCIAVIASCNTTKNSIKKNDGSFNNTSKLAEVKYPLADTIYKYTIKGVTGYKLSNGMKIIANDLEANKNLEADVRQVGQGIIISFADNDMFPFGEYRLNERTKENLRHLAYNLKGNPNVYIAAFGRTDPIGTVDFNEKLGYRRAAMVANYLRSCGINEDRLFVDSFGEKYPELLNKSKPSMSESRRVDILVIPSNEVRKYSGI